MNQGPQKPPLEGRAESRKGLPHSHGWQVTEGSLRCKGVHPERCEAQTQTRLPGPGCQCQGQEAAPRWHQL